MPRLGFPVGDVASIFGDHAVTPDVAGEPQAGLLDDWLLHLDDLGDDLLDLDLLGDYLFDLDRDLHFLGHDLLDLDDSLFLDYLGNDLLDRHFLGDDPDDFLLNDLSLAASCQMRLPPPAPRRRSVQIE